MVLVKQLKYLNLPPPHPLKLFLLIQPGLYNLISIPLLLSQLLRLLHMRQVCLSNILVHFGRVLVEEGAWICGFWAFFVVLLVDFLLLLKLFELLQGPLLESLHELLLVIFFAEYQTLQLFICIFKILNNRFLLFLTTHFPRRFEDFFPEKVATRPRLLLGGLFFLTGLFNLNLLVHHFFLLLHHFLLKLLLHLQLGNRMQFGYHDLLRVYGIQSDGRSLRALSNRMPVLLNHFLNFFHRNDLPGPRIKVFHHLLLPQFVLFVEIPAPIELVGVVLHQLLQCIHFEGGRVDGAGDDGVLLVFGVHARF